MQDEPRDYLPKKELYIQLAEEAAELAQAAVKMYRAITNINPTDKTMAEANENLIEEYTDVINVAEQLYLDIDFRMMEYKNTRWIKRIKEALYNDYAGDHQQEA